MSSFKICFLALLAVIFILASSSFVRAGDCLIRVDFKKFRLIVTEQGRKEKKIFAVGLPRYKFRKMPIKGRVIGIEKNPCWVPTEGVRAYYRKKYKIELPDYMGSDHPGNPMGAAKILIAFDDKKICQSIRIHGTEDTESIGERQSPGCIRMRNEDILTLIKFISGKKTDVIFE